jgi:hypothetical protein
MDVESISGSAGETLDLRARSIEALVAITIEHTEDRVVAAPLIRPLFGTLDDADGRGAFCIVGDHHLRRGQIEVNASRLEIRFLRLALAYNQRYRAWFALSGTSPELRPAAYFGDMATGHVLTVQFPNHGNRTIAPLQIPAFECFVLARPVIEQRV